MWGHSFCGENGIMQSWLPTLHEQAEMQSLGVKAWANRNLQRDPCCVKAAWRHCAIMISTSFHKDSEEIRPTTKSVTNLLLCSFKPQNCQTNSQSWWGAVYSPVCFLVCCECDPTVVIGAAGRREWFCEQPELMEERAECTDERSVCSRGCWRSGSVEKGWVGWRPGWKVSTVSAEKVRTGSPKSAFLHSYWGRTEKDADTVLSWCNHSHPKNHHIKLDHI